MKKHVLGWVIFFLPFFHLFGNPVIAPQAMISEFKFNGAASWDLEITFQYTQPFFKNQYDSICVGNAQGFSRIRLDYIADSTILFVVTSDSLVKPLSFNSAKDIIRLYSYYKYLGVLRDSVIYGSLPKSTIDTLPVEYSISRIDWSRFVKCNHPSIGNKNDTTGTCGFLKGYLYNKNDSLITKGIFSLDYPLVLHADGSYSTSIYSRKIQYTTIGNTAGYNYITPPIDTLVLNINPGSTVNADIHLHGDYIVVGIQERKSNIAQSVSIFNYPNPFNLSTNFVVTVPSSLSNTPKQIHVYNALGQNIRSLEFTTQQQIRWDGTNYNGTVVSSGMYFYQLIIGTTKYRTGSMILLK